MLTLRCIENPFSGNRRILKREIPMLPTAGDVLDRYFPLSQVQPIVNGGVVNRSFELHNGDELSVYRMPRDVGGIITYIIISTLLTTALSYGVSLLLPPPKPAKTGGDDTSGSPTYQWAPIENTDQPGSVKAKQYGKHRIGGQRILKYRRNAGGGDSKTNYLYILLSQGHGPIYRIGQYSEDMDDLVTKGSMTDDFSGSGDLQETDVVHPFWTKRWGTLNSLTFSSGFGHYDGSGHCGYSLRDDVGLRPNNCEVHCTFHGQTSSAYVGVAINMDDEDNYHAIYQNDSTHVRLVKRVAGVQTTLGTYSYSSGDEVVLSRYNDVLTITIDDAVIAEVDADTDLRSGKVGIIGNGSGTADLDDFRAKGVFYLPTGMQINGVDANTYTDIVCHIRLGREFQSKMESEFARVIQGYKVGTTLSRRYTIYTCREQIKGFHVNLDFPDGLFDQTGSMPTTKSVTIEVEYRPDDDSDWTPIPDSPITIEEQELRAFTRTIIYEPSTPLSGTAQQIRVRRLGTQSEIDQAPDRVVLGDINEYIDETTQRYANDVLIAMRIKATDQLSGGIPTITTVNWGCNSVPTWDGESGSAAAPDLIAQFSTNPIWIIAEMILDKRQGLGNFNTIANINWENFASVAAKCNETLTYQEPDGDPIFDTNDTETILQGSNSVIVTDSTDAAEFDEGDFVEIEYDFVTAITTKTDLGDGRTEFTLADGAQISYGAGWTFKKVVLKDVVEEKQFEFHHVFDYEISALEAMQRVAAVCRSALVKIGSQWNIRHDGPSDPVALITESNILSDDDGESTLEISELGDDERADIVEVQFTDQDANYEQQTERAGGVPPASLGNVPITKTIQLYGCTSASQARRYAHYQRQKYRLIDRKTTFELPIHGLAHLPGDVIRIASPMPDWSYWTGTLTGTLASFTISQELILKVDVTYKVLVRTLDHPEGVEVTIASKSGTYNAGDTIETDGDATVITDAAAAIGDVATYTRSWAIIDWQLTEEKTIQVEAHKYDENVYSLFGWVDGEVEKDPPGCVAPGTYFYEWGTAEGDPGDCTPPAQGTNTCTLTALNATIEVSGDAEACVSIGRVTSGGFFYTISEGCDTLEFCLAVSICRAYTCCHGSPQLCNQCLGHCSDVPAPTCLCKYSFSFCKTICE